MTLGCPVCLSASPATEGHCGRCGFPVALREFLDPERLGTVPPPSEASGSASVPQPSAVPSAAPTPPAVLDLLRRAELLRSLGIDDAGIARALSGAAVEMALGAREPAAEPLRAERQRTEELISEGFRQRWNRIRDRRKALVETGIDLSGDPDQGRPTHAELESDPKRALQTLEEAEAELRSIESDWHDIEQLFEEITVVRQTAEKAGWSIVGIPSRVTGLRASLSGARVRPVAIASAAREARQEREELAQALLGPARAELESLRARPAERSDDPLVANRTRAIGQRAERHLTERRIAEALRDIEELRGRTAPGPSSPSAPSPPTSPEGAAGATAAPISRESLFAKVRGLAGRVRALPSESETGRRAAAAIREATELLRQGRLEEADSILTRLKLTFDASTAQETPP